MIISVASGKGGTGKTTIAMSLATSIQRSGRTVCLLDADVEAPNTHLFVQPLIEREDPVNLDIPHIDMNRCTTCGRCADICEFNALAVMGSSVLVFKELCHACGGCTLVCPEKAVTEIPHRTGTVMRGKAGSILYAQGILDIGEAKAPPVIDQLKTTAPQADVTIIDAPPGTSCPMVEAVRETDLVVLVTEPTPFGLNDLKLAVDVVKTLSIPHAVVINRSDIGDDRVERYCREENLDVVLRIPNDRRIAEGYSSGELLIDTAPEWETQFRESYQKLRQIAITKPASQIS